jgi:hypothetical protein
MLTLVAKKSMKMKAVTTPKAPIIVFLYPTICNQTTGHQADDLPDLGSGL